VSDALSQPEMKVTAYDRVSSMLVSLLILVGGSVLVLFVIWLSARVLIVPTAVPVPVEMVELLEYSGRGDHAAGFGRDAELGAGDVDEPSEAAADATADTGAQAMTDQVAALDAIATETAVAADAASPSDASLFATSGAKSATSSGDSYGVGTGKGKGIGDSRRPGPLGEGRDDIVPPWERCEVRFATTGIQVYAKQLDFFKIELGAVGGGSSEVDYAYNFQKAKPDRRPGTPEKEDRLYMTWRDDRSPIAAFDQQLLQRAGINTRRRVILQFFPKDIERLLLTLEAQQVKGRDPRTVLKTVFGVREVASGYEFYVIEVRYRPVPKF
jgi:hypothetical protein